MSVVIYLATDHAGYEHKEAVKVWLKDEGYTVKDFGAYRFDGEDDFTDFISKAAQKVSNAPLEHRAIIFGGSGQGEAMLANRFRGVRAAVYYGGPESIVTLSREHNDANVLSIGARFVDINLTKKVVWTWLHTAPLADSKYKRRNNKIAQITKRISNFLAKEV